jgi:hypothetical protein
MPQVPQKRTMPAKMQANYPKNSRSAGRAAGMLTGVAATVGVAEMRRRSDVGNAEMRGYKKGKVDGRQTDSSGAKSPKTPNKPRVEPKSKAPVGSSYMTKALMK